MRKFLYIIVFGFLIVAAAAFALRLYSEELTQIALVPSAKFEPPEELEANAYADPAMWFSRPGMGAPNDRARWQPQYVEGREILPAPAEPTGETPPPFAVFFIHPTSFFDGQRWNAPLDDAESQDFAKIFVRGLGSAFNQASEIWAPRYRQATFGAFLTASEQAQEATDAAYHDVAQAFDYFLANTSPETPIVLAGHSQGSLHILRLLREKIAGTALQGRIATAYAIGLPISLEHDLPALPLPACQEADSSACIVSWASFADDNDPALMLMQYRQSPGLDGEPRGDGAILCVNPLTGRINDAGDVGLNLGTLVPSSDLTTGELVRAAVPARCDNKGLLLIGDPPEMGAHVLPQGNYHVYDIPLFWANLQADVVRRVRAWQAQPR